MAIYTGGLYRYHRDHMDQRSFCALRRQLSTFLYSFHYHDVIMSAMASHITSLVILYSFIEIRVSNPVVWTQWIYYTIFLIKNYQWIQISTVIKCLLYQEWCTNLSREQFMQSRECYYVLSWINTELHSGECINSSSQHAIHASIS